MQIIEQAVAKGRTTLSEHESKEVLKAYGIPVTREVLVQTETELSGALQEVGFPLVMKACAPEISHKTEKGLVRVDIRSREEAEAAFAAMMAREGVSEGGVLVQELVQGQRELVVGLTRDAQFGPCVMFGLGGIFTEILKDIVFRVAPLETVDAMDMMGEIRGAKILDAVRGLPAADRDALAQLLLTVGRIGVEQEAVQEIDINPVILSGPHPVAVDALIVLKSESPSQ